MLYIKEAFWIATYLCGTVFAVSVIIVFTRAIFGGRK
jgi:hypothetical protein